MQQKQSYCKQEIIGFQHAREEGAMHLNCNKEVGYQRRVLLVRTVSMRLGYLGSLWHLQLGSSPRQGVEHPETSWATVASAWLEFYHNLEKNARYRTKTNSVPSLCGDRPLALFDTWQSRKCENVKSAISKILGNQSR